MVRRRFLLEKTNCWACFEASGLSNIFHLKPHCDILDKSSLRVSDEELESYEPPRKLKYHQQKV